MQTLLGAREALTTPPFQATVPTFYELLGGSEANETVRSARLAGPLFLPSLGIMVSLRGEEALWQLLSNSGAQ